MSSSSPPSHAMSCDQCNQGRENTCFHLRFLGTPGQGDGCLSEFIVMPEECCFPIDGKISIEQGVLCEPLAIGAYAVKQARLPRSADVAIFGSGPIGLSCMVCARAEGVRACYMTEKIDRRMEVARKGGADLGRQPAQGGRGGRDSQAAAAGDGCGVRVRRPAGDA